MRFLQAEKLKCIYYAVQTSCSGKSLNVGSVESKKSHRHFRPTGRAQSHNPLWTWRPSSEGFADCGAGKGLLSSSQKLMGSISEGRRWGISSRASFNSQRPLMGQGHLWAYWWTTFGSRLTRSVYTISLAEKFRFVIPWRPVILVSLVDHKGQVLMRSLGLIFGEAIFLRATPTCCAEQFHGKTILNSLNPHRMTIKGQSLALLSMTVETVLLILRGIYLLALFMPSLLLATLAENKNGRIRTMWIGLLLKTLEHAGPAFIKWGQWAATRPDIFPGDVCDSLSKLHMQAPAHTFQETKSIVERAFRVPLESLFEEFSEDPVASGSIAQVHRAVMKMQGTQKLTPLVVAVKVRHPGVSEVIQKDFIIIKWLAKLSTCLPGLQHLQLDKSVQQFASFMTKQVDLTLEAAHLLRFIYNFRRSKNVSFPSPIYPLVHPAVLVETYEEGQSIANFVDSPDLSPMHSRLAYIGSSTLLKMLLMDNFIHGDLHPGNIFVRFKGTLPHVILLDVGMTAELNQKSRGIMLELFKAVASKDGRRVAECTLKFSEEQSCPDPEAFARDVDFKFKEYLSVRGTARNTGECMTELFDQVRKHRVNMDGDVCTVMVTTLILEGWQRKLDPDLDIIKMLGQLLFTAEWAIPYEYALSAVAAP